jgi:hypothetical protein
MTTMDIERGLRPTTRSSPPRDEERAHDEHDDYDDDDDDDDDDVPEPQPPPSPRTYYRRRLPSTSVSFSSPGGRAVFASALAGRGARSFFPLIEQLLSSRR